MSPLSSRRQRENGGVLVLFTILLVPLMLILTLAIDGFMLMAANLQQKNNAEYSAEAAALQLWVRAVDVNGDGCKNGTVGSGCSGTFSMDDVMKTTNTVASNNLRLTGEVEQRSVTLNVDSHGDDESQPISAADSTFSMGCWDGSQFTDQGTSNQNPNCGSNSRAVRVSIAVNSGARIVPMFAKIFGYSEFHPHATAVAWVNGAGNFAWVKGTS